MNISCIWLQAIHSDPHVFNTSCGRIFETTAKPVENQGYRFCPYCGGSLGVAALVKNPELQPGVQHPIAWRYEIVQEPEISDAEIFITESPAQPIGRPDHVRS